MNKKTDTIDREAVVTESGEAVVTDHPKKAHSVGVRIAKYATALVVALVLFWFGFTTVVKEGSCTIIMRFGNVREQITEPGLYFKLPWPFESTVTYDNRLQYLESNRNEAITADSSNVIIQSYVAWQIVDPVLYHNSTIQYQNSADVFLKGQVYNAVQMTVGSYELSNLVSLETEEIKIDQIQEDIYNCMAETCRKSYGIEIKDVSILRLSFPDANLTQVFSDMRTARQSQINKILADAYSVAQGITDTANVEAEATKGQGKLRAAEITEETERRVAAIYAAAYTNGLELYQFLQELDTLVASVNGETVMIINMNDAPFNVLQKYANTMEPEGDKTAVADMEYLLSQMSEEDQQILVDGVRTLLENYDPVEVGG